MDSVIAAARHLGIDLDVNQREQFRRYGELIELRSKQFNLTGAKYWERIREELFIRSLRILNPAGGTVPTADWFIGRRVIDIGTGAGIPGLVMKIALPQLRITLLDSISKRIDFVREVVTELDLKNVEVINGRAEALGQNSLHRERYDLVTARGVAGLAELAELTIPFANIGGTIILPKGTDIESELNEAALPADILGAAPAISITVDRPGQSPPDQIVYWMKISPTPVEFPRSVGIPHRSPITKKLLRQAH